MNSETISEIVPAAQSAGAGEFQSFWDEVADRLAIQERSKAKAEGLVASRNLTDPLSSGTI